MAQNATNDTTATQPAEGEGLAQDAQLSTAAQIAAEGRDPSNTYEDGVPGNVNTAVPEGATVVATLEDAYDAGYFGYAPGAAANDQMTFAAAAERANRQRDARKAVVNRSAEDADGHTADKRAKTPAGRQANASR